MNLTLIIAILITTIAGLSLVVGGYVSLRIKKDIFQHILSFAGGVMIYISVFSFIPSAMDRLREEYGVDKGFLLVNISFFAGLLATLPIDIIVTCLIKKKIRKRTKIPFQKKDTNKNNLYFIFISITIHNFFEGVAAFITYFANPFLAIFIVLSIIFHNLPEGAAIATSIYKKSKSRRKALWFCLISALAEPIGAIVAYMIIAEYFIPQTFGIVKAFLAGLLINTALSELIPGANMKGNHRLSMRGIVLGMLCMGVLILLDYLT